MTLEVATNEAELAARIIQVEMCVVNAPLEHGEQEPFGYCPIQAVPNLYKRALIVKTFKP